MRQSLALGIIAVAALGSSACGREAEGSALRQAVTAAGLDAAGHMPWQADARRLWAGEDFNFYASSPSPDGRYVTEIDWTTGDLAVRDLADGTLHRVTQKGGWTSGDYAAGSAFSPDGAEIVFAWWNSTKHLNELRVLRFEVDGSGTPRTSNAQVIHSVTALQPYAIQGWSPDGWILTTVRRPGRTAALALISADNGEVRVLESLDWSEPLAARSPDGSTVAYSLSTGTDTPESDIWLLSIDGLRKVPGVDGPTDDVVMGWEPDGTGLLFARREQGSSSLYRLPVESGEPAGPPQSIHADLPGSIVPLGLAGGALFVGVIAERTRFHVARLEDLTAGNFDATETFADPHGGSVRAWAWSPDGSHFVHDARGSHGSPGGFRVVVRSLAGDVVRHFPLQGRAEHLRWAPDGRTIFMQAWDATDRPGVRALDLQSGELTTLRRFDFEWQHMGGHIDVSPDGRHIYYRLLEPGAGIRRPTRGSIMRLDRETGDEEPFFPVRWGGPLAVSPDGTQLAFVDYDAGTERHVIRSVPTTGGEPRDILAANEGEVIGAIDWTPDGRTLVFVSGSPGSADRTLFEVSVASGDVTLLADVPTLADSEPRIHPDGRRIVYRAGTLRGEIWAIDGLVDVAATVR